jgi:hypothetical protein
LFRLGSSGVITQNAYGINCRMRCGIQFPVEKEGKKEMTEEIFSSFISLSSLF